MKNAGKRHVVYTWQVPVFGSIIPASVAVGFIALDLKQRSKNKNH